MNQNQSFKSIILISGVAILPLVFDFAFFFKDGYELLKQSYFITFLALYITLSIIRVRSNGLAVCRGIFDIPLIFFLASGLVSFLFAADHIDSAFSLLWMIAIILTYTLMNSIVRFPRDELLIFRAFGLSGLLVAVYGILQFFSVEITSLEGNYDSISTLGHRNVAAEVLILLLPVAISWFVHAAQGKERFLAGASALAIFTHLLFTKSRGAWLGGVAEIGLVIFILIFIRFKKLNVKIPGIKLKWIVLTAIFLVLLVIASSRYAYIDRFASSFNPSHGTARFRLLTWESTIRMIKDYPLFGVGLGCYAKVFPKYRNPREIDFSGDSTIVDKAHNDVLQFWSEMGMPGLLSWIFILLLIGYVAISLLNLAERSLTWYLALTLIVACSGSFVQSLFGFGLSTSKASSALFWCFLGIISVTYERILFQKPPVCVTRLAICKPGYRIAMIGIILGLLYYSVYQPLAGSYWFRRGEYLRMADQYQSAVVNLLTAIRHIPYDYRVHHQLAYNYERLNQLDASEAAERKSLELFPLHRDGYFNIGYLYERRQDWAKAADMYNKALELYPENLSATNNLAVVLQRMKKVEEAKEVALRGLQWHPYSPDLHNNLGACYFRLNDFEAAAREFLKVLELRNTIIFPETTVNHYAVLGQIEFRITVKDKNKRVVIAPNEWGRILFKPGAEQLPEIFNPASGGGFIWDAENRVLKLRLQEVESSESYLIHYRLRGVEGSFEHNAKDFVYAKAYNNYAQCMQQLGRYQEAEKAFLQAIEVKTDYPQPLYNLGMMYLAHLNNPEKARTYLEACVKLGGYQEESAKKALQDMQATSPAHDESEGASKVSAEMSQNE